jgi:5-methylcytosine-specific restriction endonuclease McrA
MAQRIEHRPLERRVPLPQNPRIDSDAQVAQIAGNRWIPSSAFRTMSSSSANPQTPGNLRPPMLPKRGCCEHGCGGIAVSRSSRCEAHTLNIRTASQRIYDDRRGTRIEGGYDAAHERLRVACFVRDDWRCCTCGWEPQVVADFRMAELGAVPVDAVLGELRRAKLAGERHLHMDHVLPIATHPGLRLGLGNVQTLCSLCHARKTMAERQAPASAGGTGSRSEKLARRRGDQRWPSVRQSAHKNFLFLREDLKMPAKQRFSMPENVRDLRHLSAI